jgi:hypothetical protein
MPARGGILSHELQQIKFMWIVHAIMLTLRDRNDANSNSAELSSRRFNTIPHRVREG